MLAPMQLSIVKSVLHLYEHCRVCKWYVSGVFPRFQVKSRGFFFFFLLFLWVSKCIFFLWSICMVFNYFEYFRVHSTFLLWEPLNHCCLFLTTAACFHDHHSFFDHHLRFGPPPSIFITIAHLSTTTCSFGHCCLFLEVELSITIYYKGELGCHSMTLGRGRGSSTKGLKNLIFLLFSAQNTVLQ